MAWCIHADLFDELPRMDPESIDSCVCDPPYELGFMGKGWDKTGIAYDPQAWQHVYRVLKPGAHLLAFGGTRTYHRMACAIEDAGFEIRDMDDWLYGTGFPKSKNIGRAIDMHLCTMDGRHYDKNLPKGDKARPGDHLCPAHPAGDPWRGWGTGQKPAQEPICVARKPLVGTVAANVLAHGTGGLNVDGCRIAGVPPSVPQPDFSTSRKRATGLDATARNGEMSCASGRWPANVLLDPEAAAMLDAQSGTLATRGNKGPSMTETDPVSCYGKYGASECGDRFNYDSGGGASRFFYVAKASKREREAGLDDLPVLTGGELTDRIDGSDGLNSPRAGAGRKGGRRNRHPTVKPIALMRWLVRLVTPPGGVVLDPFCGSGSTGCAAVAEGFAFVGIEREEEYVQIANRRIAHWAEVVE